MLPSTSTYALDNWHALVLVALVRALLQFVPVTYDFPTSLSPSIERFGNVTLCLDARCVVGEDAGVKPWNKRVFRGWYHKQAGEEIPVVVQFMKQGHNEVDKFRWEYELCKYVYEAFRKKGSNLFPEYLTLLNADDVPQMRKSALLRPWNVIPEVAHVVRAYGPNVGELCADPDVCGPATRLKVAKLAFDFLETLHNLPVPAHLQSIDHYTNRDSLWATPMVRIVHNDLFPSNMMIRSFNAADEGVLFFDLGNSEKFDESISASKWQNSRRRDIFRVLSDVLQPAATFHAAYGTPAKVLWGYMEGRFYSTYHEFLLDGTFDEPEVSYAAFREIAQDALDKLDNWTAGHDWVGSQLWNRRKQLSSMLESRR